ncbi:unnamed protein product [Gordionus sp. m RMFG-2023]|uniref:alpha- and gamma-adaptin-binding protein p34-like isoform X3 n=1 Tax=Gordionus sp. m RMFG-2023 TaxID=3053472 RepID=UPI0030E56C19
MQKILVYTKSKNATLNLLQQLSTLELAPPLKFDIIKSNTDSFLCKISNKYYGAEILIDTTDSLEILDSNELEIFLYYLEKITSEEFNKDRNLDNIKENFQLPDVKALNTKILLLESNKIISDNCNEEKANLKNLTMWCIRNDIQLICLNGNEDHELGYKGDQYEESNGYFQLIEAIQAHKWPFVSKIKGTQQNESDFERLFLTNIIGSDNDVKNNQSYESNYNIDANTLNSFNILDPVLSFEDMFSRIDSLKKRTMEMPNDERKNFAEKVAISFWKAIKGDESEIEGIQDDSD